MLNEDFQSIIKAHMDRYRVLKQSKQYEESIKELEMTISLMSKAIMIIFGRKTNAEETPMAKYLDTFPKPPEAIVQNLSNLPIVSTTVRIEDVINPKTIITIDQFGNLKIKK